MEKKPSQILNSHFLGVVSLLSLTSCVAVTSSKNDKCSLVYNFDLFSFIIIIL